MESVQSISWYVIRTKPCQEERAAENLEYWGIQVLAPRLATKKEESKWKPFFPGYIFAKFDIESKLLDLQNQTQSLSRTVNGVLDARTVTASDPTLVSAAAGSSGVTSGVSSSLKS